MKDSKLLMLGILAVSLAFATSAVGQCDAKLSCGNTAYYASGPSADTMAICVYPGDEVYYKVTVGLGEFDCEITNGLVWIDLPDGRHIELDDDLALLPNSSMTYDLRNVPGWVNYVVNCVDPPSFSRCEALSNITGAPPVPSAGEGTWTLYCIDPCIEVTKTPNMDVSKAGDTVIYTICVTNCTISDDPGICDPTLYNVQVEDPLFGPGPLPGFPSELAVGDTVCLDFPYLIQPGDPDPLINVVTATAVDSKDKQVEDSDDAEVDLVHPSIAITKTVNTPTSKAGDPVTYTITVTNTSPDVSLENIEVTDPLLGPGPLPGFPAILAAGASSSPVEFTRTIQVGDPDPLVNTATVHADPLGPLTNDITANDSATVDLVHPSFTVEKDCPATAEVGETILYLVTITNTGDVDLVIVSAIDSLAGLVPSAVGAPLPQGVPITFPYNYTVLPSDPSSLVNTVTVTVGLLTDPPLPNELTESDSCTTEVHPPGTEVTISASPSSVCEGEIVTLTICEQNTGGVPLTNVSVLLSTGATLAYPPDTDSGNGDDVLNPGEIWCWDVDVTVNMTTTYSAIGQGTTPSGVVITYPDYPSEYAEITINTEECGGEGCTPGFWKNNGDKHGASAWDCFSPGTRFSDIFVLAKPLVIRGNGKSTITNPTLLQALGANGGGVNAMIRHGVAAMLNACSDCVQYATNDPLEIIIMIEDTLNGVPGASYTVGELHSMFAENNEAGCPVNQHGDCVGVED